MAAQHFLADSFIVQYAKFPCPAGRSGELSLGYFLGELHADKVTTPDGWHAYVIQPSAILSPRARKHFTSHFEYDPHAGYFLTTF